jgi:hypothetical protein
MRSLRARLTVFLLAGTGVLLAAGGLLLDRVIGSRLRREYDEALLARARSLVTLTEQEDGKAWLEFSTPSCRSSRRGRSRPISSSG